MSDENTQTQQGGDTQQTQNTTPQIVPVTRTAIGEYAVYKRLRQECLLGLAKFGINEGADVRRFAQASLADGDKLVLLNHIENQRIGWQAFEYKTSLTTGDLTRTDNWIDEQTWQVSFIKRMLKTDTVDTVTADDMCCLLMGWLNGNGMLNLRKDGIAVLPIDSDSIMVYNDNSDLYQRRPVFTMNLQIVKKFTDTGAWIDAISGHVKSA